jgi:hypothetical protein
MYSLQTEMAENRVPRRLSGPAGKYCYMCEVSLVVALALLQQCNSTTSRFLSYTTILGR